MGIILTVATWHKMYNMLPMWIPLFSANPSILISLLELQIYFLWKITVKALFSHQILIPFRDFNLHLHVGFFEIDPSMQYGTPYIVIKLLCQVYTYLHHTDRTGGLTFALRMSTLTPGVFTFVLGTEQIDMYIQHLKRIIKYLPVSKCHPYIFSKDIFRQNNRHIFTQIFSAA